MGDLKGLLAGDNISEESYKIQRKQVERMMLNVTKAKQMAWIRNKKGYTSRNPREWPVL